MNTKKLMRRSSFASRTRRHAGVFLVPLFARLRALLSCATACVILLTASSAVATGPDIDNTVVTPLCATDKQALVFFVEYTNNCGGAHRDCTEYVWGYAFYAPKTRRWTHELLGSGVRDQSAEPGKRPVRTKFARPKGHACAEFFLMPDTRLLAGLRERFRYSVSPDGLVVALRRKTRTVATQSAAEFSAWQRDPDRSPFVPATAKLLLRQPRSAAYESTVGDRTFLVLHDPSGPDGSLGEGGSFVIIADTSALVGAQVEILTELAAAASVAGDSYEAEMFRRAILALQPSNREARLAYARGFAAGYTGRDDWSAQRAVDELEKLRGTSEQNAELLKTLQTDVTFIELRSHMRYERFLDTLK